MLCPSLTKGGVNIMRYILLTIILAFLLTMFASSVYASIPNLTLFEPLPDRKKLQEVYQQKYQMCIGEVCKTMCIEYIEYQDGTIEILGPTECE